MQEFYDLQEIVFSYLCDKNKSPHTIKNYHSCYDRLERYLIENNIGFSLSAADDWLEKVCETISADSQRFYRAPIMRLHDAVSGIMIYRHFPSIQPVTLNLCTVFKNLLEQLLNSFDDCSEATIRNRRRYICHILLRLQKHNVFQIEDISYDVLLTVLEEMDNGAYYSKPQNAEMMNYLLKFLYECNLIPYGYTLLASSLRYDTEKLWRIDNVHFLTEIMQYNSDSDIALEMSLQDYLTVCGTLLNTHSELKYSSSYLGVIRRVINLFFLFLDYNNLCYSPDIGVLWLRCIEPEMTHSRFNNFRRVILLIQQTYLTGRCNIQVHFLYTSPKINLLPEWCGKPAAEFIDLKIRERWADNTIDDFRCAVYRFCQYLVDIGFISFERLDAETVKRFNIWDKHLTPQGKNAYNSRIRKFIEYLSEAGYIHNQWLFLALTNVSAPNESLVVTLTEAEQEELKQALTSDNSALSLRDKAILQLGLYMGIRGCDIVNLTLDNIMWERATISFVQSKTSHGIELPMPDQVANSIYQYIMHERPQSKCKHIFIKHQAPYDSLGRQVCTKALNVALPDRNVPGSGFHVTRKTCATSLLNNGASANVVMETLGHRDTTNLNKYLSLDESNMRLCPLSLHDCDLELEGGFA